MPGAPGLDFETWESTNSTYIITRSETWLGRQLIAKPELVHPESATLHDPRQGTGTLVSLQFTPRHQRAGVAPCDPGDSMGYDLRVNFSHIASQSLVGRILRLPLRLIPNGTTVRICSGPLRGYRWIVGSSIHGCWLGTYEQDEQRAMVRVLRAGAVFYDLGANVGFYSLLASSQGCKVFAFEPVPRNLDFLRRHIALNRITTIEVFDAAVSDFTGTAQFKDGPDSSQGALSEGAGYAVRVVSLDQLGLPKPNFMKIDVEGGEYRALLGAERTIRASQPTIFLATHGAEVHRQCCEHLLSWGYTLDVKGSDIVAVP